MSPEAMPTHPSATGSRPTHPSRSGQQGNWSSQIKRPRARTETDVAEDSAPGDSLAPGCRSWHGRVVGQSQTLLTCEVGRKHRCGVGCGGQQVSPEPR